MVVPRLAEARLRTLAASFPVVTVTGPRQSGKTTLCRAVFPGKAYVTLEAPDVREFARRDPRGFLADLAAGAILDEIQRVPDLLSYLQGEVDDRPESGRFILTGSANLRLLESVSQSLAGRTAVLDLLPLSFDELGAFPNAPQELAQVLWTGGYPAIFDRGAPVREWLRGYTATFVERDLRQVVNVTDLVAFQGFMGLCAGRTAQLLNLTSLGADAGIAQGTARAWLAALETSYLAQRLPAWSANVTRRLVRAPKMHLLDSGLACYLLGIESPDQLRTHPLRGAIFESWVAAEVLKSRLHRAHEGRLHHYRDAAGSEVDLVIPRGTKLIAIEAKSGRTIGEDFFRPFEGFRRAVRPAEVVPCVVYGGDDAHTRSGARVIPWRELNRGPWVEE